MKILTIFFATLIINTACAGISPVQNFKEIKDDVVRRHVNISLYIKSPSLSLLDMTEVQTGMVEYSFVEIGRWFTAPEERCKFILVVEKDSGTIIDWRYNGKPEYCYVTP